MGRWELVWSKDWPIEDLLEGELRRGADDAAGAAHIGRVSHRQQHSDAQRLAAFVVLGFGLRVEIFVGDGLLILQFLGGVDFLGLHCRHRRRRRQRGVLGIGAKVCLLVDQDRVINFFFLESERSKSKSYSPGTARWRRLRRWAPSKMNRTRTDCIRWERVRETFRLLTMAVVAVLEIHMERNAVVAMNPNINLIAPRSMKQKRNHWIEARNWTENRVMA